MFFVSRNVFGNSRQCIEFLASFATNSFNVILKCEIAVDKNSFSQPLRSMVEPLTFSETGS